MSNQRTNIPPQPPLAQLQAHPPEFFSAQVVTPQPVGGVSTPVQGPNYRIPPGGVITIRSASSAAPAAADVLVSKLYERSPSTLRVIAGSPSLAVIAAENLNELWFETDPVMGTNDHVGGSVEVFVTTQALE